MWKVKYNEVMQSGVVGAVNKTATDVYLCLNQDWDTNKNSKYIAVNIQQT